MPKAFENLLNQCIALGIQPEPGTDAHDAICGFYSGADGYNTGAIETWLTSDEATAALEEKAATLSNMSDGQIATNRGVIRTLRIEQREGLVDIEATDLGIGDTLEKPSDGSTTPTFRITDRNATLVSDARSDVDLLRARNNEPICDERLLDAGERGDHMRAVAQAGLARDARSHERQIAIALLKNRMLGQTRNEAILTVCHDEPVVRTCREEAHSQIDRLLTEQDHAEVQQARVAAANTLLEKLTTTTAESSAASAHCAEQAADIEARTATARQLLRAGEDPRRDDIHYYTQDIREHRIAIKKEQTKISAALDASRKSFAEVEQAYHQIRLGRQDIPPSAELNEKMVVIEAKLETIKSEIKKMEASLEIAEERYDTTIILEESCRSSEHKANEEIFEPVDEIFKTIRDTVANIDRHVQTIEDSDNSTVVSLINLSRHLPDSSDDAIRDELAGAHGNAERSLTQARASLAKLQSIQTTVNEQLADARAACEKLPEGSPQRIATDQTIHSLSRIAEGLVGQIAAATKSIRKIEANKEQIEAAQNDLQATHRKIEGYKPNASIQLITHSDTVCNIMQTALQESCNQLGIDCNLQTSSTRELTKLQRGLRKSNPKAAAALEGIIQLKLTCQAIQGATNTLKTEILLSTLEGESQTKRAEALQTFQDITSAALAACPIEAIRAIPSTPKTAAAVADITQAHDHLSRLPKVANRVANVTSGQSRPAARDDTSHTGGAAHRR